jgi:carboxyl-terminal processing protease
MLRSAMLVLLVAAVAGPLAASPAADPQLLVARVWGLAKYHHPELVTCRVDWDGVLLSRWAALEAVDADGMEAALVGLLDAAGSTPRSPLDAATPDWIATAPLTLPLRERLAWLAAQQPASQCKVTPTQGTAQASFDADQAYATPTPDRAHRALAALRYWNAIEFFFPYKDDIGRDWGAVLEQHLPLLLAAEPGPAFATAMRRFTAEINDSHGVMSHPGAAAETGAGFPPIALRLIEGRTVVVRVAQGDWGVSVGDEVLAIDGEPIAERIARLDADAFGSNPAWRDSRVHVTLGTGPQSPGRFVLRRPDGSDYEVELPRGASWPSATQPPPVWRREVLDGCTIGVVNVPPLQRGQIDGMLAHLRDTDALLFDVRGYPQGVLWDLVDRLFDAPQPVALFTRPRLDQPGRFAEHVETLGGRQPIGYQGRFLLLQNEASISQSEYTLMGLQASGRAITFGSQTAAADGNITRVHTPGAMTHTFTGLGVFYPDGRPTQRIGIVPDVHVAPTRAGLIAGRDELLEAALDCRWIDAPVPQRRLPAGLYFSTERDGEGIDVQPAANGMIGVFSYGYDDDGATEWWLAAGDTAGDDWSRAFTRRTRDGAITSVDGFELDPHRGPYAPVCAIADQSRLHPRARWQGPAGDDGGDACVEPLLLAEGPASGAWAGTGAEDGWGVSLHHRGNTLAVVVYAYDGAGAPRWLIGNAPWTGHGEVEIALLRPRGFCRACAAEPLTMHDAGVLTLRLDGVHSGNGADSWLSIDADFGDGERWQRERMPLVQITGPRP